MFTILDMLRHLGILREIYRGVLKPVYKALEDGTLDQLDKDTICQAFWDVIAPIIAKQK